MYRSHLFQPVTDKLMVSKVLLSIHTGHASVRGSEKAGKYSSYYRWSTVW